MNILQIQYGNLYTSRAFCPTFRSIKGAAAPMAGAAAMFSGSGEF